MARMPDACPGLAPPLDCRTWPRPATLLMKRDGRRSADSHLFTLICDGGDRYAATDDNPAWLVANNLDIAPWQRMIETFLNTGTWSECNP